MLALYRSGRQADALEVYQRTRRSLDDELGIEPGPALRELERKILNQDESLGQPRPRRRRCSPRRRHSWRSSLAALVLSAAAAAATFVVTRDSEGGLDEVLPNYVGMIDSQTNTIVAAIPAGARPGPIAVGGGSVWVGNVQDRSVTKIDPLQRAPLGAIPLGARTPTGIAVGARAVWVAHGLQGELSRIDPQFGPASRRFGNGAALRHSLRQRGGARR